MNYVLIRIFVFIINGKTVKGLSIASETEINDDFVTCIFFEST